MLLIPKDEHYRKVLGNLKSKVAMNLKCGACASCSGSGSGGQCKCTGVGRVTKNP